MKTVSKSVLRAKRSQRRKSDQGQISRQKRARTAKNTIKDRTIEHGGKAVDKKENSTSK